MEINKSKQEAFVAASDQRIQEWAKINGFDLSTGLLIAIYAELNTMYESGFSHCQEQYEQYEPTADDEG